MTEKQIHEAFDSIPMDPELSRRLWERLEREGAGAATAERPRRRTGKLIRTLLIAAAIAVMMGATAYATDFLGLRAMKISDPAAQPHKLEVSDTGEAQWVINEQGAFLSMSQPQEIPENMDPAQAEKIRNSQAAWAEWKDWHEAHRLRMPEIFEGPEGTSGLDYEENSDGSYTVHFYDFTADGEFTELGSAVASAEEVEQFETYLDVQGRLGIQGYDHSYHVQNQEQAQKLEEIAAKYGLALRREQTVLYGTAADFYRYHPLPEGVSLENLTQGDKGLPLDKLLERMNAALGVNGFREKPAYIDHAYWYEEGSFGISFEIVLDNGSLVEAYGYRSPYGTLSSGYEIFNTIEDQNAYSARSFTAKDGTELTILESSDPKAKVYFYAYLEDSFFAWSVECESGLDTEAIDRLADVFEYQML